MKCRRVKQFVGGRLDGKATVSIRVVPKPYILLARYPAPADEPDSGSTVQDLYRCPIPAPANADCHFGVIEDRYDQPKNVLGRLVICVLG